jgi:hypothetical protein
MVSRQKYTGIGYMDIHRADRSECGSQVFSFSLKTYKKMIAQPYKTMSVMDIVNVVNNFNEIYGAAVDVYIDRTSRSTFTRDGETWYVDCGLCMRKSENYKLPNAVVELLSIGVITGFRAHGIYLELHTRPKVKEGMFNLDNMTFMNYCIDCGSESYNELGYVWTNNEETVCEDCVSSFDAGQYTLVDVTEYNATDYVLFGEDSVSSKYYVNCNTASSKYGSVLCIVAMRYPRRSVMYSSVEHFMQVVHEWIVFEPVHDQVHEPDHFLDQWEMFLKSPVPKAYVPRDSIIYGFPENMTYYDAMVKIDYRREFSEELVRRCAKLLRDRTMRRRILDKRARRVVSKMKPSQLEEYAHAMIKKHAGRRMFDGDILTFINMRTLTYKGDTYKSFGNYVWSR